MCKLCNSTKPAQTIIHYNHPKEKERKHFRETVKEYTGEFPCRSCTSMFFNKSNKCEDLFIISMLRRHYTRNIGHNHSRLYYVKHSVKRITIEPNIRKVENTATGSITFSVYRKMNKKAYSKNFNTLEEAQEFKQRIKDEHKRL